MLVYDEKMPRHFWRIAIVTGVLPSRDSEISGEIDQYNPQRPANKLFTVENTCPETNQTSKSMEQKLKREAASLLNINIERGKSLLTLQIIIF